MYYVVLDKTKVSFSDITLYFKLTFLYLSFSLPSEMNNSSTKVKYHFSRVRVFCFASCHQPSITLHILVL